MISVEVNPRKLKAKEYIVTIFRRIRHLPGKVRVKVAGAIVGQNVHLANGGRCVVGHGAQILIGSGSCFHSDFLLRAEPGAQIYIGENVHFGERTRLTAGPLARISIGSGCWFNHDCVLDSRQERVVGKLLAWSLQLYQR